MEDQLRRVRAEKQLREVPESLNDRRNLGGPTNAERVATIEAEPTPEQKRFGPGGAELALTGPSVQGTPATTRGLLVQAFGSGYAADKIGDALEVSGLAGIFDASQLEDPGVAENILNAAIILPFVKGPVKKGIKDAIKGGAGLFDLKGIAGRKAQETAVQSFQKLSKASDDIMRHRNTISSTNATAFDRALAAQELPKLEKGIDKLHRQSSIDTAIASGIDRKDIPREAAESFWKDVQIISRSSPLEKQIAAVIVGVLKSYKNDLFRQKSLQESLKKNPNNRELVKRETELAHDIEQAERLIAEFQIKHTTKAASTPKDPKKTQEVGGIKPGDEPKVKASIDADKAKQRAQTRKTTTTKGNPISDEEKRLNDILANPPKGMPESERRAVRKQAQLLREKRTLSPASVAARREKLANQPHQSVTRQGQSPEDVLAASKANRARAKAKIELRDELGKPPLTSRTHKRDTGLTPLEERAKRPAAVNFRADTKIADDLQETIEGVEFALENVGTSKVLRKRLGNELKELKVQLKGIEKRMKVFEDARR